MSAVVGETKATGPHAHGLPEAGNLAVWRSTDQGRTWKRTGAINDVPGAAREGLHAMVNGAKGLVAAWLDLREKGTKLYSSRSTDGGRTWSKNELVYASPDGTICQCCHPSLAIDEAGRIHAMWRNALDGSRDLYLSSSATGRGFDAARKIGAGTWKLNACPMDGGALAVDKGKIVSAWRRDGDVFLAEEGGVEKKMGTGKDVALAIGRKGKYVAWTHDGAIQVLPPNATTPLAIGPGGGFVSLLALPEGGVLAAWEANGAVETMRVE